MHHDDGPSALNPERILPLPYHPSYEVLEEDEDETRDELVKTLLEISDTTYKDTQLGLRSVHAKCHGVLKGELRVLALPPVYAQGLFAAPATHPVAIRLSTAPGDLLDDRISTTRGFALKVGGVQGPRVAGASPSATQDFLCANGPVFLAPNAKRFLSSLKLLAATTDRMPRLKLAFAAVARGTEKLLEAVGTESATLKGLGGHPTTHILGETFFSAVPFLYGPYMAKWQIAPVSPGLLALKDVAVDLEGRPDGLREAVVRHFAATGGEWELRAQLCTDIERMPIEDASVEWLQDESPFVAVARITVPPQPAYDSERAAAMDDGLAFSPWHALAAHRPLGSVNRVRRLAYQRSAEARSPRGRCPVHGLG